MRTRLEYVVFFRLMTHSCPRLQFDECALPQHKQGLRRVRQIGAFPVVDAPLFDVLMERVFEQIKPLLKAAEDQSFDVLFEDLNINLERALNGLGEVTKDATIKPVKVKPEPNPFPSRFDSFPSDLGLDRLYYNWRR
jgi:hypothetical protein